MNYEFSEYFLCLMTSSISIAVTAVTAFCMDLMLGQLPSLAKFCNLKEHLIKLVIAYLKRRFTKSENVHIIYMYKSL